MTKYKYGDVLIYAYDTEPLIVMYLSSAADTSPFAGQMGKFLILDTKRAFEPREICIWTLTNWKKIDED